MSSQPCSSGLAAIVVVNICFGVLTCIGSGVNMCLTAASWAGMSGGPAGSPGDDLLTNLQEIERLVHGLANSGLGGRTAPSQDAGSRRRGETEQDHQRESGIRSSLSYWAGRIIAGSAVEVLAGALLVVSGCVLLSPRVRRRELAEAGLALHVLGILGARLVSWSPWPEWVAMLMAGSGLRDSSLPVAGRMVIAWCGAALHLAYPAFAIYRLRRCGATQKAPG